jgi:uncharacterized protein (DUF58 family)
MNLESVLKHSQAYIFWQWAARRNRPEQGRIFLGQRRVYILPTRHGITFGLALILMLIGSVNYNLSLGYVLTFLLAGVAVISILHTFRNLVHLAVSAGRVAPVFAGDAAHFELQIENSRDDARHAIHFVCEEEDVTIELPGGRIAQVRIAVPTARRGLLQLPRVTIETRYPIGLFRSWSYVQPEMCALVYPKPDNSPIPLPQPVHDSGDAVAVGAGTDDFSGLRAYQTSDSPRHIAWKAVARAGGPLLTKYFTGRASQKLQFNWRDLPADLDVEGRLSRLTRWVLLAHEAGMSYSLCIPANDIALGAGESHLSLCLQALALYEPQRSSS